MRYLHRMWRYLLVFLFCSEAGTLLHAGDSLRTSQRWSVEAGINTLQQRTLYGVRDGFFRNNSVGMSGWNDFYIRPWITADIGITRETRHGMHYTLGVQFYNPNVVHEIISLDDTVIRNRYRFRVPLTGVFTMAYPFRFRDDFFLAPVVPVLFEQYSLEVTNLLSSYPNPYLLPQSTVVRMQAGVRAGKGRLFGLPLSAAVEARLNLLKYYRETDAGTGSDIQQGIKGPGDFGKANWLFDGLRCSITWGFNAKKNQQTGKS